MDILSEVYNKIFDIEKYRSDPNYEGATRTLPPQGIFEISSITALSESSNSQIAAGDQAGNLMVLDLSKKMRIAKKEIGSKRIIKVVLGTRDHATDDYKNIPLIALIAHLDPTVYIYRYKPGDNKLIQHHSITLTKSNQIGEMPINIELSLYSQYIAVTQYNGNVLVYKIPDITAALQPIAEPPKSKIQKPVESIPVQVQITIDQPNVEIKEPCFKVIFKGFKKEAKYDDILAKMKEQYQNPIIPEVQQQKEDPKKKPNPKQEVIAAPVVDDIEFNENTLEIKSINKDGIDISQAYPEPKFRAFAYFTTDRVPQQQGNKQFNQIKELQIIVGLVVGWSNTNLIEIHQFNPIKKNCLPGYLNQGVLPPIKKFEPIATQIKLLYPISNLAMSPNTTFLAVGLVQGSIYIHDMALQQERFYLDKHIMQVTKLSFCDDWRLVSGSYDGSVHIYDLREGKLLCKRTNQFRKGTKVNFDEQKQGLWQIIGLGVSQSGVAAVLDAGGEVRLYDVWHGEKIAKLNAQQVMDDKLRRWNTSTPLLSCYRNEILILSDIVQEQQQTSVEIFKIFDNLINLYSSLSNVYRKGVEKEKIIHLFERLDKKDLNNPSFEVPNLATNKLAVPSADQVQSKSQSNRLSGGNKKSVFIKNDSKVQPSKNASRVSNPPVQSNEQASLVNSLHKSINSELVDFNSSYRSQQTSQHRNTKAKIPQQMLTKEMLHPEQYLLEKEKIPLPYLVQEDITMVEHCRNRNAEKRVRSEKVNSLVQKLGQQMALEEEKRIKEDLQRKLKQVK